MGKLSATMTRTGSVLLVGWTLNGCAMLNPHLEGDADLRQKALAAPKDVKLHGRLPDAIGYADGLRQKYYAAVGQQSLVKNGLALALIPLTATAVYLGISGGAGKSTIGLLGVGAAGGFAAGSFLYNKPIQKSHLLASRSIGCAILGSRPLLFTEAEYRDFKGKLDDLNAGIPAFENVVDAASAKGIPVAAVTEARRILDQARTVAREGERLNARINAGAITLVTSVDNIRDQISESIVDNEADFAKLEQALLKIAKMGPDLVKVPEPKAAAGAAGVPKASTGLKMSQAGAPKVQSEADLRALTVEMAELASAVGRYVNAASALADEVRNVPGCKTTGIGPAMVLQPDKPLHELKAGAKLQIGIVGGNGVPRASFVGTPPEGKISVEMTLQNSVHTLVIAVKADAAADTVASVLVTDGLGTNEKKFDIKIVK